VGTRAGGGGGAETRGAGGADDERGRGAGTELGAVSWVGAGRGAADGWAAFGVRARTELVSFAVDGETADGPTAAALAEPTTFSGFMRATIQQVPF
jgi:hypothetical protein